MDKTCILIADDTLEQRRNFKLALLPAPQNEGTENQVLEILYETFIVIEFSIAGEAERYLQALLQNDVAALKAQKIFINGRETTLDTFIRPDLVVSDINFKDARPDSNHDYETRLDRGVYFLYFVRENFPDLPLAPISQFGRDHIRKQLLEIKGKEGIPLDFDNNFFYVDKDNFRIEGAERLCKILKDIAQAKLTATDEETSDNLWRIKEKIVSDRRIPDLIVPLEDKKYDLRHLLAGFAEIKEQDNQLRLVYDYEAISKLIGDDFPSRRPPEFNGNLAKGKPGYKKILLYLNDLPMRNKVIKDIRYRTEDAIKAFFKQRPEWLSINTDGDYNPYVEKQWFVKKSALTL